MTYKTTLLSKMKLDSKILNNGSCCHIPKLTRRAYTTALKNVLCQKERKFEAVSHSFCANMSEIRPSFVQQIRAYKQLKNCLSRYIVNSLGAAPNPLKDYCSEVGMRKKIPVFQEYPTNCRYLPPSKIYQEMSTPEFQNDSSTQPEV